MAMLKDDQKQQPTEGSPFEAAIRRHFNYPDGPLTAEMLQRFQQIEVDEFRNSTGKRTATVEEVESGAARLRKRRARRAD